MEDVPCIVGPAEEKSKERLAEKIESKLESKLVRKGIEVIVDKD